MASRRDLLEGCGGAGGGRADSARSARRRRPTPPGPVASDDDVDRMLPTISNWGRWGPDDQLGTLNFITPEMRAAAAQSVRSGRTVSLAHERPVADSAGIRRFTLPQLPLHRSAAGRGRHDRRDRHDLPRLRRDPSRRALPPLHPRGPRGHVQRLPDRRSSPTPGAAKLGVEVMGVHGIVGRGVLLDVAALKGGPLAARQRHPARRPRGGGGAAGRHRRHRRHPVHPQRRRRRQQLRSSAPGCIPSACPGCTPARSRRSATTATATCTRRSPASRAGPSPCTWSLIPYLGMPLICGCRPRGDLGRLRRGGPLQLLPQRRPLALQGRHQLAGEPAGDVLSRSSGFHTALKPGKQSFSVNRRKTSKENNARSLRAQSGRNCGPRRHAAPPSTRLVLRHDPRQRGAVQPRRRAAPQGETPMEASAPGLCRPGDRHSRLRRHPDLHHGQVGAAGRELDGRALRPLHPHARARACASWCR